MGTLESLVLLYCLLAKHAIADLLIQSIRKPGDKTNFKDPKGYLHALDHGILTALVVYFLTYNVSDAIIVGVADTLLHYIIDYIKSTISKRNKLTTDHKMFWVLQAVDQLAHYTCYFGIAIYLL